MNRKVRQFKPVFLFAGLLLVGLILANGCKKSEPTESSAPAIPEVAAAAIEQTMCPVMDGAINKDIFTEYKGTKVYFCCPGCKEKFEQSPEQYVAKLPQFK